jgi:hypothetical protein
MMTEVLSLGIKQQMHDLVTHILRQCVKNYSHFFTNSNEAQGWLSLTFFVVVQTSIREINVEKAL